MLRGRAIVLAGVAALTMGVQADVLTYIGNGTSWNDPANWMPAQEPGPADDLIVGGGLSLLLSDSGPIDVGSLRIEGLSTVTTDHDTTLNIAGELVIEVGSLFHMQSSIVTVDTTRHVAGPAPCPMCGGGGLGNPTTKDQRDIIVETIESGRTYLLGGRIAATPGSTGSGFYANDTAENIQLDGSLSVGLIYGFEPLPGDVFDIMSASVSFTGQFAGLADGDVVASFPTADLTIQYHAGGVRLVGVVPTSSVATFSGPGMAYDDPANWDIGRVPGPGDTAVIDAGQTVELTPDAQYARRELTSLEVRNGSTLIVRPTVNLAVSGDIVVDARSLFRGESATISSNRTLVVDAGLGGGPNAAPCPFCGGGPMTNPTSKDQRDIIVEATESGFTYVLGGTIAASPGNTGDGFYANDMADNIQLDGILAIGTLYGFVPQPGDVFDIMTARESFTGRFRNHDHGTKVASILGSSLVIEYHAAGVRLVTVADCTCEVDGQPGTDVFDLLAYLADWFAEASAADRDGDLDVDVFDLLAFLECWFPASMGEPCG